MDTRRLLRSLIIFCLAPVIAFAGNSTSNILSRFVDNKTMAEMKALYDNFSIDNATMKEVKSWRDNFYGPAGRTAIDKAMKELSGDMNVYYPDNLDNQSKNVKKVIRVTVFISESVPMGTLRNYVSAADGLTRFVIRGPIGKDPSKIQPTINFITTLLCGAPKAELTRNSKCKAAAVEIDPPAFREYGIKKVPAILVETDNGTFYRHIGAAPVEYVLSKIK
ncbi:MAG: hypothetical protein LBH05_03360 [Deferribacteraceae bacterium]|jgi:hypothetical protein|nr:hypothetical protein [Deferribacteraceae bacterium]